MVKYVPKGYPKELRLALDRPIGSEPAIEHTMGIVRSRTPLRWRRRPDRFVGAFARQPRGFLGSWRSRRRVLVDLRRTRKRIGDGRIARHRSSLTMTGSSPASRATSWPGHIRAKDRKPCDKTGIHRLHGTESSCGIVRRNRPLRRHGQRVSMDRDDDNSLSDAPPRHVTTET